MSQAQIQVQTLTQTKDQLRDVRSKLIDLRISIQRVGNIAQMFVKYLTETNEEKKREYLANTITNLADLGRIYASPSKSIIKISVYGYDLVTIDPLSKTIETYDHNVPKIIAEIVADIIDKVNQLIYTAEEQLSNLIADLERGTSAEEI